MAKNILMAKLAGWLLLWHHLHRHNTNTKTENTNASTSTRNTVMTKLAGWLPLWHHLPSPQCSNKLTQLDTLGSVTNCSMLEFFVRYLDCVVLFCVIKFFVFVFIGQFFRQFWTLLDTLDTLDTLDIFGQFWTLWTDLDTSLGFCHWWYLFIFLFWF